MHTTTSTLAEAQRETWLIASAVLTGVLTMAFGMFAVILAVPKIMTTFGVSVNAIQWVMTGYLIARAVPTPAVGWLVSCVGKRKLFLIGVVGITVCSILSGLAWSLESLIFFRVLQGALGAPVMAVGMVLLYEAFPPHRQGMAMGLLILVASFGPTSGQLIGGYLVEWFSWRSIFFLSLPSGIASVVLTLLYVPRDTPNAKSSVDLPGLASLTGFLITLLLALSQGQKEGWDSTYIICLWITSCLFFGIFIVTELCVERPVVNLRLYRHIGFTMASVVVFLYNAGFMGASFLVALMLQAVFDFTPIQSGLVLAPGAAAMGLAGFLSGRLSDRFDARWLTLAGLLCFAVNLLYFASLTLSVGIGLVTLLVIIQRGGFGMIHSSINTAVMRTLPDSERSMGSGLHNLHRGVGMAFGVSFCSMWLEKRLAVHSILFGQQHDRYDGAIGQALDGFQQFFVQAGAVQSIAQSQAVGALNRLMNDHVRMAAYTDCFAILALFFLATLIPTFLMRSGHKHQSSPVKQARPRQEKVGVAG